MKIFLWFLLITLSLAHKNNRIIGGQNVAAGQYTFLAAIYKTTPDGTYFCGGALINRRWILTAGQCVDGATLFTIYLGTNNIKSPGSTALKVATEEYILHPEYNPTTLENDIGLIKLRTEITYTDYVSSISVTSFDLTPSTGGMLAFGWGQINDENSSLSDELQLVKLVIISNQECKMTYGNQITDNMMCLSGNFNEGICHGDIGSPVVWYYKSVGMHQGIASFLSSNGCENSDPSGFTKTYNYRDWILSIVDSTK